MDPVAIGDPLQHAAQSPVGGESHQAERDDAEKVIFPEDLIKMQKDNPVARENLDSQKRLFESRRKSIIAQTDILKQQISQKKEEINGLRAQIKSSSDQLALLREEIAVVKKLLKSGNAMKPRLLALERTAADIEGKWGESLAMVSRAEQAIGEAEINIVNLKTKFLNEVMTDLRDTQVQISDLEEKMRAAADTMNRIEIASPLDGTVVGLKSHTVGGVITPGQPIMDIVPRDDLLIIEAKVLPQDIDVVYPGLLSRVQLTAYKTRKVPPVEGEVKTISADRLTNERTGESYFLARIGIPKKNLDALPEKAKLYPGMPADVLIITGKRTPLSYLFGSLTDYFSHAFREQ